MTSGNLFSCAILNDGTIYCWGKNNLGQLGDGTNTDRSTPVEVTMPAGKSAVQIDALQSSVCAVMDDNSVYCWGYNGNGQLGTGNYNNQNTPTELSGLSASSVQVGYDHACAIITNPTSYDANVRCWGLNTDGQLGDGTTTNSNSPITTTSTGGYAAESLDLGALHSCAVNTNDAVYCWGDGSEHQLGDGSTNDNTQPVSVDMSSIPTLSISSISLGWYFSCAIMSDDSTYCWGKNNFGQLGDGTGNDFRQAPEKVHIPDGRYATHLQSGQASTCALLDNQEFVCWGRNFDGAIGDGSGQYGDGTTSVHAESPIFVGDAISPAPTSQTAADAGYYVPTTGQSSQTECAVGTYQA